MSKTHVRLEPYATDANVWYVDDPDDGESTASWVSMRNVSFNWSVLSGDRILVEQNYLGSIPRGWREAVWAPVRGAYVDRASREPVAIADMAILVGRNVYYW